MAHPPPRPRRAPTSRWFMLAVLTMIFSVGFLN
jgi:hypothetical protein